MGRAKSTEASAGPPSREFVGSSPAECSTILKIPGAYAHGRPASIHRTWENFIGGPEVTMNTNGLQLTIAIVGIALLGTEVKAASSSVQARIPFEFVIGEKVLPPADYIVDIAGTTGPSVLTIRAAASGDRVMFDTDQ